MKIKWWIILIFLIPLVLIGWWVSTFFAVPEKKVENPLYKVTRGTLAITVIEKGTLEPKEVTQLTPNNVFKEEKPDKSEEVIDDDGDYYFYERGGNLPIQNFTIQRVTPKGTKVNKGDLLVEFDYTPVKNMIEQIKNELKTFKDQYEQRINELKTQKRDLELKVEQSRLALDRALENYNNLWKKIDAGEMQEDDIQLQEAGLQVKEQRRNLENTERELLIVKVILRDYSAEESSPQPESTKKNGKGTLQRAPTAPEPDPAAVYAVPKKSTYYPEDVRLEPREVVDRYLRPVVDIIQNIEERQKKYRSLLKYPQPLALYAPHAGHLFYGSHGYGGWYTNESQIREGGNLYFQQPTCYVTNTTDMKVPVNVDEININKLRKGLKAKVTPEALPDVVLNGQIAEIGEIPGARNPWMPPTGSEGKYPVMIELADSDPRLRPKMSTRVEITCEEIKDVILVPVETVFEKEIGKKVCFVLQQGKPVERVVKIGKSNENLVIIEEGLKEGEEIYLIDPFLKK